MDTITATPQYVYDTTFGLNVNANNVAKYLKLKRQQKTLILNIAENVNLYEGTDKVFLLDEDNQKILYYMEYLTRSYFGRTGVTQIKIWSDVRTTYTEKPVKITSYVFWYYLMLKTGLIVSDSMQTRLGARFWEKRVSEAFDNGFKVYFLNQNTKDKIEIKDYDDYIQKLERLDMYGDELKHQAMRVAITNKVF